MAPRVVGGVVGNVGGGLAGSGLGDPNNER